MSTIVTRSGKGSPLTHNEVDANFTNLNTDKYQSGDAATFTTLTATGQTSLGGDASLPALRVNATSGITRYCELSGSAAGGVTLQAQAAGGNPGFTFISRSAGVHSFSTNGTASTVQFQVSHTTSAVNYVQVTGAATTAFPVISAQGSDSAVSLGLTAKGGNAIIFFTNSGSNRGLRVSHTASSVNYVDVFGGATGSVPVIGNAGSDSNIGLALKTTGTGAIDLAAGSSGVNISNGGTVTAITRTNAGSGYTSFPSVAISAPTTAGGVQATASVSGMAALGTAVVVNGGTGYTAGDVLTPVGGTGGSATRITVSSVSGGVITGASITANSDYTVLPTNPVSVTGGTGSGATFNLNYAATTFTITNAGSGYVEQPTVTFSGGGGSGAAAYATVGSTTVFKSLADNLSFQTAAGTMLAVVSTAGANSYPYITGGNAGGGFGITSAVANAGVTFTSKGTSAVDFYTNSYGSLGLRVSHTASAVNYVQVTGGPTGAPGICTISTQGSDSATALLFINKGGGAFSWFNGGATSSRQFRVGASGVTNAVNYINVDGSAAGSAPSFQVIGTDTNIDLALTPKGTGLVRFGTRTASADAPITGYIEIKDSGGTTRRLAVIG